jgi:hypothetical protein
MPKLYRVQYGIGFDRAGVALTETEVSVFTSRTKAIASQLFGGITLIAGQGSWVSATGETFTEPSVIAEIYTDTDCDMDIQTFADMVKTMFRQSSVLVYALPVMAVSRFGVGVYEP